MATSRTDNRSRGSRRRAGRRGADRRTRDPQPQEPQGLPYTRRNARIFAAGLAVILIGYICLAQPPAEGFLSLTLAPILLVLGYCVLIPIALLLGDGKKDEAAGEVSTAEEGG